MTERRPLPVPDEQSKPYWEAASRHVLTAARCAQCGAFSLPPDLVCPHCGTTEPDFEFTPVSGRGIVRSWTVVRESFLAGFDDDLPFVLVDVELADQPDLRTIGRLLDGLGAPLHLGSTVDVGFEDIAPGVSIPAFVLTS